MNMLVRINLDLHAGKIRLNGQLPPSPVNQNRKLEKAGTAEIHDRIHGGPNGAAGKNDIVHQNQGFPLYLEREVGLFDNLYS